MKRTMLIDNTSDDDLFWLGSDTEDQPVKKRPKRVIQIDDDDDDEKELSTIYAEQEEKERIRRLMSKQREFNGIEFETEDTDDLDASLNDSFNKANTVKSLILDNNDDDPVQVHKALARLLKPHQAKGIQFMYNCTIESLDRLNQPGGGGILAHCMGLGKTCQSVTFLHTIMTHPTIAKTIKRALVVCPKNVIINWANEFEKWLGNRDVTLKKLRVFEIDSKKDNKARLRTLKEWYMARDPSVMIIGYESYRNLTQDYTKPNKKTGKIPAEQKAKKALVEIQPELRRYLQDPGPDIVICDEGHKLKNIESETSITMAKLKTKRRICLTGTPMQNNLTEYFCMVDFVKKGLLGNIREFKKRYEKPISDGQLIDANEHAVKTMRRRCYVLFRNLEGIIDRQDFTVLKEALLPKHEYVITLRLTEKQLQLYKSFVENECQSQESRRTNLLSNYYIFSRIFTHPFQIISHQEEKNQKAHDKLEDFIVDDSDYEDNRSDDAKVETNPAYKTWLERVNEIVEEEDRNDISQSYKLLLTIEILKQAETIGDKVLIFSQSLETIRLIERFLKLLEQNWFEDGRVAAGKKQNETWKWKKGVDYFLINGSVSSTERDSIQQKFNRQNTPRARLCLISTKAGSLGTNFVGANRVIVFDQNWNPTHDRQALFRAYRFGQVKPTYIYRFVAYGTIENVIYSRQVTKESVAARVIDESQVKRHYSRADLDAMYMLKIDDYDAEKPPQYSVPKDQLLAQVFVSLKEGVVNCVQHDSLLAHQSGEELNEEERQLAWQEFERKFNAREAVPSVAEDEVVIINTQSNQLNQTNDVIEIASVQQKKPLDSNQHSLQDLLQKIRKKKPGPSG